MSQMLVARQFIKDADGNSIGVILPMEDWEMVSSYLEKIDQNDQIDSKLAQLRLAASDPLFLDDLKQTMTTFETADAEWWERA